MRSNRNAKKTTQTVKKKKRFNCSSPLKQNGFWFDVKILIINCYTFYFIFLNRLSFLCVWLRCGLHSFTFITNFITIFIIIVLVRPMIYHFSQSLRYCQFLHIYSTYREMKLLSDPNVRCMQITLTVERKNTTIQIRTCKKINKYKVAQGIFIKQICAFYCIAFAASHLTPSVSYFTS